MIVAVLVTVELLFTPMPHSRVSTVSEFLVLCSDISLGVARAEIEEM